MAPPLVLIKLVAVWRPSNTWSALRSTPDLERAGVVEWITGVDRKQAGRRAERVGIDRRLDESAGFVNQRGASRRRVRSAPLP